MKIHYLSYILELLVSAPETVVLAETNEVVKVKDVKVGTLILVCAGEQIPLDGTVVKGKAAVDESSITGEAMPLSKEAGGTVYSGTILQNGFLKVCYVVKVILFLTVLTIFQYHIFSINITAERIELSF